MLVLLHVSLEENCDLIKCISTIYEHWKIVNYCPHKQRSVSVCFSVWRLDLHPWRRTLRQREPKRQPTFSRQKPTNAIALRITVRGECEIITNCECVCVCVSVWVCICVFSITWRDCYWNFNRKQRDHIKVVPLYSCYCAFFYRLIAIWYESFALIKLLLKLN